MGYEVKVLADSIAAGVRLCTLQVTYPRFVLAEMNTHRVFSRNSASSRAIPVEKRCATTESSPFIPAAFGKNRPGMQSTEVLDEAANEAAEGIWRDACADAVRHARRLAELGVHKQYANRLIEPFVWITQIISSTEWANFFALRCSPEAQPEIRRAAELMREAMDASTPVTLFPGDWHTPFSGDGYICMTDEDNVHGREPGMSTEDAVKLSVARCARVSYLTHDGKRDPKADLELHDRLLKSGHMSPFEHAAKVASPAADFYGDAMPDFIGNFRAPWVQYRKTLLGEAVFGGAR